MLAAALGTRWHGPALSPPPDAVRRGGGSVAAGRNVWVNWRRRVASMSLALCRIGSGRGPWSGGGGPGGGGAPRRGQLRLRCSGLLRPAVNTPCTGCSPRRPPPTRSRTPARCSPRRAAATRCRADCGAADRTYTGTGHGPLACRQHPAVSTRRRRHSRLGDCAPLSALCRRQSPTCRQPVLGREDRLTGGEGGHSKSW